MAIIEVTVTFVDAVDTLVDLVTIFCWSLIVHPLLFGCKTSAASADTGQF